MMSDEPEIGIDLRPQRAAQMVDSGEADVIDVRRDWEWEAGHLEGSRRIEVNELAASAEEIPRERPVIFVCRVGNRSAMAAEAFRQAGWDAYHVEGGLRAWVEAGLPLKGEVADPRPE
jgi:rhodanese-related sulfurtransferase